MDLMFQPLRKYADFTGRARRMEFWLFWLLLIGIEIVFSILIGMVGGSMTALVDPSVGMAAMSGPAMGLWAVYGLIMLGLLIPSLAVSIRRLHDTNRSGWWMLLVFLPLIGQLVLLVFMVLDGTPGANRFGPDPKQQAALPAPPGLA